MLVLSRHVCKEGDENGEKIVVTLPDGRTMTIAIIEIRGDKVRVGLDAPKDVIIHRNEIAKKIEESQNNDQ